MSMSYQRERRFFSWPIPIPIPIPWLWLGALLALCGCSETPERPDQVGSFRISFRGAPDLGSLAEPLPFSTSESYSFIVDLEALRLDNPALVDTGFNGYGVITVLPAGKTAKVPHAVRFEQGKASGVEVVLSEAYGAVRLVVSEEGYQPGGGQAACNNQRDDDGDGYIDFPSDRGCYYANDESEGGGSGAVGLSQLIHFANPRLEDIQRPSIKENESALWSQRVTIDRGFILVNRVSTDGLYLTDYDGVRWDPAASPPGFAVDPLALSYRSIFAFNFSTPVNITEGDCLVQLDGTVEEFYGYTELGKPTWKKGDYAFCANLARQAGLSSCPVDAEADPEAAKACRLELEALANTPLDVTRMMVEEGGSAYSVWEEGDQGAERFESALVQLSDVEMFTELRYCDQNGNGAVDFDVPAEKECSNSCGDDPLCVVGESYDQYEQWTVHFEDGAGVLREVAVGSRGALPKFDPLAAATGGAQPRKLSRLIGTMRNLEFGRPAWILEPRRAADCPDCVNQP